MTHLEAAETHSNEANLAPEPNNPQYFPFTGTNRLYRHQASLIKFSTTTATNLTNVKCQSAFDRRPWHTLKPTKPLTDQKTQPRKRCTDYSFPFKFLPSFMYPKTICNQYKNARRGYGGFIEQAAKKAAKAVIIIKENENPPFLRFSNLDFSKKKTSPSTLASGEDKILAEN